MKFEPGVLAVAIAVLLFYARLAQIRGRNRKQIREQEIARLKSKDKKKREDLAPQGSNLPLNYQVGNYFLLALGVVLLLFGLALFTYTIFPDYRSYWWVAATLGMVSFIFCVK